MFHSQEEENNFHFHVSQGRLSFLMAAMSGKEKVMLGLMNARVWGKESWVGIFN